MPIEHGYNVNDCGYKIMTSHGMMTAEQLEDFNKREQQRKEEPPTVSVHCPIRNATCRKDCAFYGACGAHEAEFDTKDMNCPYIGAACSDACGAYNKGCTIRGK